MKREDQERKRIKSSETKENGKLLKKPKLKHFKYFPLAILKRTYLYSFRIKLNEVSELRMPKTILLILFFVCFL